MLPIIAINISNEDLPRLKELLQVEPNIPPKDTNFEQFKAKKNISRFILIDGMPLYRFDLEYFEKATANSAYSQLSYFEASRHSEFKNANIFITDCLSILQMPKEKIVNIPCPQTPGGVKVPSLFLDRDGVINVDTSYLSSPDEIKLLPGIVDLICYANSIKMPVFIVTNQSGVGRGMYTEDDIHLVNNEIIFRLEQLGAKIQDVRYCPFHPKGITKTYKVASLFRKPNPGMIFDLSKTYNIDFEKSFMIGDKPTDQFNIYGIRTFFLQGNYDLSTIDQSKICNSLEAIQERIAKEYTCS